MILLANSAGASILGYSEEQYLCSFLEELRAYWSYRRSFLRPFGLEEKFRLAYHRWRGWAYRSETSKCRARLAPYCMGYGLDLGFGGGPSPSPAIRVDLPQPYAYTGDASVQLGGGAENLYWFKDGVLVFVYSSHLIEDYQDAEAVLREWLASAARRPSSSCSPLMSRCTADTARLRDCRTTMPTSMPTSHSRRWTNSRTYWIN